jgi:Beta-lactamase
MLTNRIISGEAGQPSGQLLVVPWWSFTKTVLAGAVLALVARRRLDLNEPVEGYRIAFAICCNTPPDFPTTMVCQNTTLPWLPVTSHGPAMSCLGA